MSGESSGSLTGTSCRSRALPQRRPSNATAKWRTGCGKLATNRVATAGAGRKSWRLSRAEEYQHILSALASFQETVGQRPQGWYCRYGPSVHTRELLVEEGGFVYDADAYNDDLPYFTTVQGKRHLVVPYSLTYNDARFVLAQGYGSPSDFADSLKRAFDICWEEGAERPRMMSIGLHPRLIGQAARISGSRTSSTMRSTRSSSGSQSASTSRTGGWRTTKSSNRSCNFAERGASENGATLLCQPYWLSPGTGTNDNAKTQKDDA